MIGYCCIMGGQNRLVYRACFDVMGFNLGCILYVRNQGGL
jgi:hypothetical protein